MSEVDSEEAAHRETFNGSLTFSETNILIWNISDLFSNLYLSDFTFRGIKFHIFLVLDASKNIRNDVFALYIKKSEDSPEEFPGFKIRTFISTKYGDKYITDATISNESVKRPTCIWEANRKSILVDYDSLTESGRRSIRLICKIRQRDETSQQKIFEPNNNKRQLRNEAGDVCSTGQSNDEAKGIFNTGQLSNEARDIFSIGQLSSEAKEIFNTETLHNDLFDCLTRFAFDLKEIYEKGIEADITLKCGDESFSVQKAILLSRCDAFFQKYLKNRDDDIIEITDMKPPVLRNFLEYVHYDTLTSLTVDVAAEVYEVGGKYGLKHLSDICSKFMEDKLDKSNVLNFLLLSDKYNDKMFKKVILCFLIKNDNLLRNKDWRKFSEENSKLTCELFQLAHRILADN